MSSATSLVRAALEGYLAGGAKAEGVARAVVDAYYRDGAGPKARADGRGIRAALRPVLEVVERAAPGVVELARRDGGPGFEVRLAERPFPTRYEAELRQAAEQALALLPPVGAPDPRGNAAAGLLGRMLDVIGRWVGRRA